MPAIETAIIAGSAGFGVIVGAMILVIVGVRNEERGGTLTRRVPPTIASMLARRVLGTYARLPRDPHSESAAITRRVGGRRDLS